MYALRRYSDVPDLFPSLSSSSFDDYLGAQRMDVTLHPGDMLFIPAGFFHFVRSTEADPDSHLNIGVSTFTDPEICVDCQLDREATIEPPHALSSGLATLLPIDTFQRRPVTRPQYLQYRGWRQPFVSRSTSVTSTWSCSKWSADHLATDLGPHMGPLLQVTRSVSRLFASDVVADRCFPGCHQKEWMTAEQFVHEGHTLGRAVYLMQEHRPDALLATDSPPAFLRGDTIRDSHVWINFGHVTSAMHYDMFNNVLTQVQGVRRVLLFPPHEMSRLHLLNATRPAELCLDRRRHGGALPNDECVEHVYDVDKDEKNRADPVESLAS